MLHKKVSLAMRRRIYRPLPVIGHLAAGVAAGAVICIVSALALLP